MTMTLSTMNITHNSSLSTMIMHVVYCTAWTLALCIVRCQPCHSMGVTCYILSWRTPSSIISIQLHVILWLIDINISTFPITFKWANGLYITNWLNMVYLRSFTDWKTIYVLCKDLNFFETQTYVITTTMKIHLSSNKSIP